MVPCQKYSAVFIEEIESSSQCISEYKSAGMKKRDICVQTYIGVCVAYLSVYQVQFDKISNISQAKVRLEINEWNEEFKRRGNPSMLTEKLTTN